MPDLTTKDDDQDDARGLMLGGILVAVIFVIMSLGVERRSLLVALGGLGIGLIMFVTGLGEYKGWWKGQPKPIRYLWDRTDYSRPHFPRPLDPEQELQDLRDAEGDEDDDDEEIDEDNGR